MYKPLFNKVLVEINDDEAKWGSGNGDSMLGASYSKGKLWSVGHILQTADYPLPDAERASIYNDFLVPMIGKEIMWHEGTESGTIFEENGKKYGLIYWFDIIGEKDEQ